MLLLSILKLADRLESAPVSTPYVCSLVGRPATIKVVGDFVWTMQDIVAVCFIRNDHQIKKDSCPMVSVKLIAAWGSLK